MILDSYLIVAERDGEIIIREDNNRKTSEVTITFEGEQALIDGKSLTKSELNNWIVRALG